MLTQEELKKRLSYDEESGLFTRLNLKQLKITHRVDDCGHVNITVNRQPYKAHRLAWLYVHGVFPSGFIDHINGIGNDNRIINLRDSTNSQNLKNQKMRKNNTSGFKGVSWSRQRGQWQAQCSMDYIETHLGYFDAPEEASKVYNDFCKEHHGEFYRDTTT